METPSHQRSNKQNSQDPSTTLRCIATANVLLRTTINHPHTHPASSPSSSSLYQAECCPCAAKSEPHVTAGRAPLQVPLKHTSAKAGVFDPREQSRASSHLPSSCAAAGCKSITQRLMCTPPSVPTIRVAWAHNVVSCPRWEYVYAVIDEHRVALHNSPPATPHGAALRSIAWDEAAEEASSTATTMAGGSRCESIPIPECEAASVPAPSFLVGPPSPPSLATTRS